jgi:hypothetical protein
MRLLEIKETSRTDIHGLGSRTCRRRGVHGKPLAWPSGEIMAPAQPFLFYPAFFLSGIFANISLL